MFLEYKLIDRSAKRVVYKNGSAKIFTDMPMFVFILLSFYSIRYIHNKCTSNDHLKYIPIYFPNFIKLQNMV